MTEQVPSEIAAGRRRAGPSASTSLLIQLDGTRTIVGAAPGTDCILILHEWSDGGCSAVGFSPAGALCVDSYFDSVRLAKDQLGREWEIADEGWIPGPSDTDEALVFGLAHFGLGAPEA